MAAYGVLKYPEFYRMGVCVNPLLDWRLEGAFVEETCCAGISSEEDDKEALYKLVPNLKGKLLLVHGMIDNCAPVAGTFRLVEALQQANKNFDMLLLPNLEHGPSKYVQRRAWDYVVQHLRGEEPPVEFEL